jgi:hypothetical protein
MSVAQNNAGSGAPVVNPDGLCLVHGYISFLVQFHKTFSEAGHRERPVVSRVGRVDGHLGSRVMISLNTTIQQTEAIMILLQLERRATEQ